MSENQTEQEQNLNEKGQAKIGDDSNFDKDPAWDIKDIVGIPVNLTALVSFKYKPKTIGRYDKPDSDGKIERHIATFKQDVGKNSEKNGEKRHRSFVPKSIVSQFEKKVTNLYKIFVEGVELESVVFFKETIRVGENDFWTFMPEKEFEARKKEDVFVAEKFTFEKKP